MKIGEKDSQKSEFLDDHEDPLIYWQSRVFGSIARVMIFSVAPLLVFGAVMFLLAKFYIFALLEALSAVFVFYLLTSKKIRTHTKKIAIIFVLYLISTLLLLSTGPTGAGFVCVTFTLVLSGCVLEKKMVIRVILINWVTFLIISILLFTGLLDSLPIVNYKSVWFINLAVVQASGIGVLYIMFTIYSGLENQTKWVKKSKEALMLSEAKHISMVANISDVITVLDKNGILKYQSPNVETLYGWKPTEVLGRSYSDFTHPDEKNYLKSVFYEAMLQKKVPVQLECKYKLPSGNYTTIEIHAINQLDNANLEGLLINFHDISQRKASENALRVAKEEAEAANKTKSRFLSVMSHEIRTPLNGMLGMIQLLEMTNTSEEQSDYLKTATIASESLLNIINDILDVSKLDAEMIKLERLPFNVNELINDVKQLYLPSVIKKGISLNYFVNKNVPLVMLGDAFRLKQILANLINNALKFTSEGRIDVTVELVHILEDDIVLKWYVKDTGSGIKPEHLSDVFESFEQGDDSTARQHGGSGLGLSICNSLVKLMGGEISVQSQYGFGSEFSFTSQLKSSEVSRPGTYTTDEKQGKLKILIAEDDEISRSILETFAKKKGWEMTLACNGQEAVDYYDDSFDIVLMDIQMPVLNGYQATKSIRMKSTKRLPIIAMTAFALSSEKEKCFANDMDDYLSKPIKIEALQRVVQKWVTTKNI